VIIAAGEPAEVAPKLWAIYSAIQVQQGAKVAATGGSSGVLPSSPHSVCAALTCVYRVLGVRSRRVCCVLHVLLLQRIVIVHYASCVPSAAQLWLAWANQF
jgi:hypothetical protein